MIKEVTLSKKYKKSPDWILNYHHLNSKIHDNIFHSYYKVGVGYSKIQYIGIDSTYSITDFSNNDLKGLFSLVSAGEKLGNTFFVKKELEKTLYSKAHYFQLHLEGGMRLFPKYNPFSLHIKGIYNLGIIDNKVDFYSQFFDFSAIGISLDILALGNTVVNIEEYFDNKRQKKRAMSKF